MKHHTLQILTQILLIGTSLTGFCNSSPLSDGDKAGSGARDEDYHYDDIEDISVQNNVPTYSTNLMKPPVFQKTEYKKRVKPGESVSLECLVKNLHETNVVMWINGTNYITSGKFVFPNDGRISLDNKYYTLNITNVQVEDDSVYTCLVQPQNITMKATLEVAYDPVAKIYADDGREISGRGLSFHEGERVDVKCNSTGKAPLKIKWSANGQEVVSDGNILLQNGHLIINKADNTHVRLYQCLADHGSSLAHATVNINIQYVPRVTASKTIVNTKENDKAELHCHYESFTFAKVLWQKNGRNVLSDSYKTKYTMSSELKTDNRNVSVLTIYNVNPSDLGDYLCIVENPMGSEKVTIHLTYSPEPPVLESSEVANQTIITHWVIHSLQPLTEIVLNYQLKGTKDWSTDKSIDHQRSKEHLGIWKIKHQFEVTDTGAWQVRIKVKNDQDWSTYSNEETINVPENKNKTNTATFHSLSSYVYLTLLLAIAIPKCFH